MESRDGISGELDGGIWAVNESKFDTLLKASELAEAKESIWENFCIQWAHVTRDDLRKPFYSGLAARMYLKYLYDAMCKRIPFSDDIMNQANFWINHYHSDSNTGGTEDYYVEQVTALEKKEGICMYYGFLVNPAA